MSNDSSQSKTEQPTSKRLRDAKQKGDVWRSTDLCSTVGMLIGLVLFTLGGHKLIELFSSFIVRTTTADFRTLNDNVMLAEWTLSLVLDGAFVCVGFVLITAAATIGVGLIQVGGVFSLEAVKPKLEKINPFEGAKRLFAMRNVFEFLKLLIKTIMLCIVFYVITQQTLPSLVRAHWQPLHGVLPIALMCIKALAWAAFLCFALWTCFDVWFQRWDYLKRHRMSMDEVKRESRESEGDPHIKHRRRQLHHEVNMANMMEGVRKANVVVVNPTHIAVALFYEAGQTDLPIVVAKGEGGIAQQIREIAEQEGIPIMRNVQLARGLNESVPLNQYIPDEFIEPVAAVLRWVRNMQRGQSQAQTDKKSEATDETKNEAKKEQ